MCVDHIIVAEVVSTLSDIFEHRSLGRDLLTLRLAVLSFSPISPIMLKTYIYSSGTFRRVAPGVCVFLSAFRDNAGRLSINLVLAALMNLPGVNAAVSSNRPSNPFGEKTVADFPYPLVKTWNTVREQIQLDDLIVSSCMDDQTDDCAAAQKLMEVVNDARQFQGRALIGHVNRSINLIIKSSVGSWMSAING
jgi:hypothetical protein